MTTETSNQAIRIVLADDHTVVRAGMRTMLQSVGQVDIVGQASDGREALVAVELHRPHILLTDISMPEMNGLEVTGRVTKSFPNVKVIILSMHTAEEYVWQALRAGAAGYLRKDVETAELGLAISTVAAGQMYLTPTVSKQVVERYLQRTSDSLNVADILTSRQREILQLIAEGRALKDIALTLRLSVKTVETHRTQLMNRLNIRNTPGLVKYAIRIGIIPPVV